MKKIPNQKDAISILLDIWRPGMVLTTSFMQEIGISAKRAFQLKSQNILDSLGTAAYKKVQDQVSWPGVCAAIESQLNISTHIGGKSALALQGNYQYQELGSFNLWLITNSKKALPNWFTKNTWDFNWHLCRLNLFSSSLQRSFVRKNVIQGFTLSISSRERAILEMIYLIGKYHRFEEVEEIFEGLLNLDPEVIQELLVYCNSIKTKRVFLYLAQKWEHPWRVDIDESKIHLGSGKREIVKGGQLNQRYQITVPSEEEIPDV